MSAITTIDIITIILSVVAIVVTIIGFFASLKFYRDGVKLQDNANRAMIKIEEKTSSIQTQVGGMFDKTLEALIDRTKVFLNFEEMNNQAETIKNTFERSIEELTEIGSRQQSKILETVDHEIKKLMEVIDTTRKDTDEVVKKYPKVTESDTILSVVQRTFDFLLKNKAIEKWVSIHEIQEHFKDKPRSKKYLEQALHTMLVSNLIHDELKDGVQHFRIGPNPDN